MKGTGSNTIVAKDVFVPEHRFLPYPAAFGGSYRTEHTDEIVYRVALVPVTILILVGSQLGHGAGGARLRRSRKRRSRGITHTNYTKQRESTGFQILLADAAMKIETARLHAFRAADDLDACAAAGRHPDVTRAGARARGLGAGREVLPRSRRDSGVGPRHVEHGRRESAAAAVARRPRRQPPRDHRVAGESRDLRQGAARRRAEHHAADLGRARARVPSYIFTVLISE